MVLTRRVREWAADHFRWIQYPEPEWRSRRAPERDWTTEALRWMMLAWALWWIVGAFLIVAICVLIALLT